MAAYRALARRASERQFTPSGKRQTGALLWVHAAEPENLLAIVDLSQRISAALFDLNVLITLPDHKSFTRAEENWIPHERLQLEHLPSEHPEAIKAFWVNWQPDVVLWTYGNLRPNIIEHVHRQNCPIALIDGETSGFDGRRDRWLPDLSRQLLDPFRALIVRSADALKRLENLGLRTGRIDVSPPLQAGGQALPCRDSDLTELSQLLGGRPVWLATNVQEQEIEAILSAHRQAARLSHRLLLILHPAHPSLAAEFEAAISQEAMRVCNWSEGEELDDVTQVLLATDHGDLGLFYRVAPVTFMGGSLVQGQSGRNPFEAAALGSAVLYGPHVSRYMPFYSRLAKAGAARIVKDDETLGAAVSRLIAPDQAAAMAHAGWDVVSQGASLTDRVIELVHEALDGALEPSNANA